MKNKIPAFAAVVACLMTSSSLFADVDDSTFEAYEPQVLVTPDLGLEQSDRFGG